MKPRQPPATLTAEDTRIHLRHFYAPDKIARFGGILCSSAMAQDRLDADLMFQAQHFRRVLFSRVSLSFPNPWWLRYPEFELHWAPIGGELYVEQ